MQKPSAVKPGSFWGQPVPPYIVIVTTISAAVPAAAAAAAAAAAMAAVEGSAGVVRTAALEVERARVRREVLYLPEQPPLLRGAGGPMQSGWDVSVWDRSGWACVEGRSARVDGTSVDWRQWKGR